MGLSIEAEWEVLESEEPEEKASFAAIGIFSDDAAILEAEDLFVQRIRSKVHLPAYRLAEWFAWNWWRQLWEPRTTARDWAMAHHMTTIGGGYVWPNVSVISDGQRILLVTKPTLRRPSEPLRYISDGVFSFRSIEFQKAISRFIEQVVERLRAERINNTNLNHIWTDLRSEMTNSEVSEYRKTEAILGFEPDGAEPALIERLIVEGKELGQDAILELAAMSSGSGNVPTSADLKEIAQSLGAETCPNEMAFLSSDTQLPSMGQVPAWRRGAVAAEFVREQQRLNGKPISNNKLAEMAGVSSKILRPESNRSNFAFALDESSTSGKIVLRSKWETGKRFELARILGDRLAGYICKREHGLFPVTNSFTYRQKFQRSFAAELLCPFKEIDEMLQGDFNNDRQEECAEYFNVSPLTVRTLLTNHGRISSDDLESESGANFAN